MDSEFFKKLMERPIAFGIVVLVILITGLSLAFAILSALIGILP